MSGICGNLVGGDCQAWSVGQGERGAGLANCHGIGYTVNWCVCVCVCVCVLPNCIFPLMSQAGNVPSFNGVLLCFSLSL